MKPINTHKELGRHSHHVNCNFGWEPHKFNLNKRDLRELTEAARTTLNKPSKGHGQPSTPTTTLTPPPPTAPPAAVFLLDFTGYTVANTSWNVNGDIVCSPANLLQSEVDLIIANVKAEYSPYNVTITTDEAIFNATPINRRMRAVFTESWEWYGQAGGTSFVNSLSWTEDAPCFVFTSLLHYNTKYIKEAAAHELGHTCGLYHHAKYDQSCVLIAEYDGGDGVTAPIMGVAYYVPDEGSNFNIGPTPYDCHSLQNDPEILKNILGLK